MGSGGTVGGSSTFYATETDPMDHVACTQLYLPLNRAQLHYWHDVID